jgi:hypothetical protein
MELFVTTMTPISATTSPFEDEVEEEVEDECVLSNTKSGGLFGHDGVL